jgi:hypothetical protein
MKIRHRILVVIALAFAALRGVAQQDGGGQQVADRALLPDPGWSCGRPEGIPVPERGALVFEAALEVDQVCDLGKTPYGRRKVHVIRGGTVTGDKVSGAVMSGGLDFKLVLSNGVVEVEQVLVLKTTDGKIIYMRVPGVGADASDVRLVPVFEAPNNSRYSWMNPGRFAGRRRIDPAGKAIHVSVYDVSTLPPVDVSSAVRIVKPAGQLAQPWTYRSVAAGEQRGEPIVSETVTLGPGQSVGATANWGRNIIPITGGTLVGTINGKVLAGGADYQKLASPMTLDARYLWQAENGDVIIVRNGGAIHSLAPAFEVREDSPYAWLNQGTYLSSGPQVVSNSVKLTFYRSLVPAAAGTSKTQMP